MFQHEVMSKVQYALLILASSFFSQQSLLSRSDLTLRRVETRISHFDTLAHYKIIFCFRGAFVVFPVAYFDYPLDLASFCCIVCIFSQFCSGPGSPSVL